jgi:PPOX class probable F420-dependent enzyme
MPSRRAQIEMTDAELRAFLDEQRVMQCATVGPRGLPHLVPLWFVAADGELRGWTYAKSQKTRNLERDPRATLGIEDGEQYHELRGVMFECDVEVEHEPASVKDFGLALFGRYAGEITPELDAMISAQAEKRVGLAFRPTRTVSWDHRKLGGAY